MGRRQQISLVALVLTITAGLIGMAYWASRPVFVALYTGLSDEDAAAVVEQLREQGVAYRLSSGGSTVQVPQEKLYELRLALAGKGLPHSSVVGFELFDRASFSTSDLQNNVSLQRALQGELERSITTLDQVRLFTDQQQPASAAVVLGLSGGRTTPAQVAAITQLVASAVPNLGSDAVTVVDTAGRLLSGGSGQAGGLQTLAQLEARRSYEDRLREHIQSMLDAVLGPHKSVVRVQAQLDFQSQDVTRQSLEPATPSALVTHEETTEETYTGVSPEVGGAAGIVASAPSETSQQGGKYSHKHESREYEYSRNVEEIHKPPGQLQRLTVAAVIDEDLGASVMEKVRSVITAAAGIDSERGDQVTVETMKIDALKAAEEEAKLAEAYQADRARERTMRSALHYGSFLITAAMVAAALYMVLRRLSALPLAAQQAEEISATQPEAAELAQEIAPTPSEEPIEPDLISDLSSIGAEAPEVFAEQLRGWMNPPDEG